MSKLQKMTRIRVDEGQWDVFPMPEGAVVSGIADARVIWARAETDPPYFAGIWHIEPCVFDWNFDMHETAHIIEGMAFITPEGGETIEARPGDVFTFAKGTRARWDVRLPLKKVFIDTP